MTGGKSIRDGNAVSDVGYHRNNVGDFNLWNKRQLRFELVLFHYRQALREADAGGLYVDHRLSRGQLGPGHVLERRVFEGPNSSQITARMIVSFLCSRCLAYRSRPCLVDLPYPFRGMLGDR